MEGSFLSPPAKRSIYAVNEEVEPAPYAGAAANGSYKRYKNPRPPLTIPDGHVAFRLLCHASLIGGFIGKAGNSIKQLQQNHFAKIRVEEAVPSTDDRVIVVIASSDIRNKVTIEDGGNAAEVSSAQEALLRVFEKILDVAEEEGVASPFVSCRLLVDVSQVGGVIGKGGRTVESIRTETRCKVRVLTGNSLPACAGLHDELIEISGDIMAVKKGLIAVSRRLQDYPPIEKSKTIDHKIPEDILPEYQGRKSFKLQGEIAPGGMYEMTYRILCSSERVGGVIGRGGIIIRSIQDDTGASISVGPTVEDCDERLITITAVDGPDIGRSPAQNATMLVFSRSVEAGVEKGLDLDPNGGAGVCARLVVHKSQIGCLMGKGGSVISEMRRATGTNIRMLGGELLPKCARSNDESAGIDEVVQITGELANVQDALYQVTERLRENFLFGSNRVRGNVENRSDSFAQTDAGHYRRTWGSPTLGTDLSPGLSYGFNHRNSVHPVGLSHNLDPSPPRLWSSQSISGYSSRNATDNARGYSALKSGTELGSGSRTAIVTNTTVEIVIPEHVLGNVYGENGSNLTRLRQISGAKVSLHDPRPGTRESIVVISGTPDETQAAQSLLHAFILTGSS